MKSDGALGIEDEATIPTWGGYGVDLCDGRYRISSVESWNHGGDIVIAFGVTYVGEMQSFSLQFCYATLGMLLRCG